MLATLPVTNTSDGTVSGYGIDLVCYDDLAPDFDETDPLTTQSLAQDNYHRLITPPGELADDLDYGLGIESWLSRGVTPIEIANMQGDAELELLKDDRNYSVSALLVVTQMLPLNFTLTIDVTPADPDLQPFKQIVAITPDGATLKDIT